MISVEQISDVVPLFRFPNNQNVGWKWKGENVDDRASKGAVLFD